MTTSFVPSTADVSDGTDGRFLGEPASSEIAATPGEPMGGTDLRRTLATVAGVLAAAGGLIHLRVIGHHTDYHVLAAGFAAMGVSQFVVALWLFRHPSRRVVLLAAGLHAAIAATWALSRTVGLGFVPGEAGAAEVGVADVVANTFSLGVIGVVVILLALDRVAGETVLLPRAVARRMTGVAAAGALVLSAIAVSASHAHASHAPVVDVPVLDVPVAGHDHGPTRSPMGGVPHLGTTSHGPALPPAPDSAS